MAEAQARVAALNNQAEQLSEQYNAAKARLDQASKAAAAANAQAADAAVQLAAARERVAGFAAQRYMTGGGSQTLQAVMGGDPQQLVDRLATLSLLGRAQPAALTGARVADLRYRQQLTTAGQASAAAAALQAQLGKQTQQIDALLGQSKQALARLTAQQRAQLVAQQRARAAAAQARAAAALAAARASRSNARASAALAAAQSAGGSSIAQRAVAAAMSKLGRPYVWAAAGPNAFDCSGLVQWAYRQAGVATAHYTGTFWNTYRHVSYNQLQPGDLVFFYADHHHVGIYVGGGMMVDAPQTGDVVKVQSIAAHGHYSGAVRVVG